MLSASVPWGLLSQLVSASELRLCHDRSSSRKCTAEANSCQKPLRSCGCAVSSDLDRKTGENAAVPSNTDQHRYRTTQQTGTDALILEDGTIRLEGLVASLVQRVIS